MEKRSFGNLPQKAACLALGTYELRSSTQAQADLILNTALDNGINYIDTAPCYGVSEEVIGNAISKRRDEYILATKCGCIQEWNPDYHSVEFTAKNIRRNLENSLRLLKTDYFDVWMLHGPSPEDVTSWKDGPMLEAMLEIKEKGIVREIGISCKNGGPPDPRFPDTFTAHILKEALPYRVFDAYQTVYGMLSRKAENYLSAAGKTGASIVSRGALRQYTPDYEHYFFDAGIQELLEEGESRQDFLIRFVLSHPYVTAVLVGTQNKDHLLANIHAAEKGPLNPEIYLEAKRRLDQIGISPLPL